MTSPNKSCSNGACAQFKVMFHVNRHSPVITLTISVQIFYGPDTLAVSSKLEMHIAGPRPRQYILPVPLTPEESNVTLCVCCSTF